MTFAVFAFVGAAAGLLGALVGVGGGILIVPCLSLFLKVPIHQAIAASIVGVVATSTATAIRYVRDDMSNVRLGMTLETATTVGAVLGGATSAVLSREVLSAVFGVVMILVAGYMLKGRKKAGHAEEAEDPGPFGGSYHDPSLGRRVTYRVKRLGAGLTASFLAGNLSGLLGIGGGPIKVPAMTLFMGIPIKAAAATSNFMIGITACASAYVYYMKGFVAPSIAVPVALGVTAGAYGGAAVAPRISSSRLIGLFAAILGALAVQMLLAAAGIRLR